MADGWHGLVGRSVAPPERHSLHGRVPAKRSAKQLRVAAGAQFRNAWLSAWFGCALRRCHAAHVYRLGLAMRAGIHLAVSLPNHDIDRLRATPRRTSVPDSGRSMVELTRPATAGKASRSRPGAAKS